MHKLSGYDNADLKKEGYKTPDDWCLSIDVFFVIVDKKEKEINSLLMQRPQFWAACAQNQRAWVHTSLLAHCKKNTQLQTDLLHNQSMCIHTGMNPKQRLCLSLVKVQKTLLMNEEHTIVMLRFDTSEGKVNIMWYRLKKAEVPQRWITTNATSYVVLTLTMTGQQNWPWCDVCIHL